ncbi:MAG: class I SAM-dependent DNA methyltransferase [Capsulimonadaceae bacterium]
MNSRSKTEGTENESFDSVAPYYEHLMSSVPYEHWLCYLEQLWDEHRLPSRRVLDLACGTGTISRMLAGRGREVVGVDLSDPMLAIARELADEAGVSVPFYRQDAADLDVPGQFDSVISLFDSLNYILQPDRLAEAFRRSCIALRPGGALIFDLNTEYAFEEGMFNQSCSRRGEALHYRWRSRYDPKGRICTVTMNFSYDRGDGSREKFKEVHRQRAYGKNDIMKSLVAAGFSDCVAYDAYTTNPPHRRSDRIFYLALKEA